MLAFFCVCFDFEYQMVSHDAKKVHSLWFKGFHDVLEKNIDQPGTNKEDSTHELLQDYYGPRLGY